MSHQSLYIVVDVDGEAITGHTGDGVHEPARFSGWLGLISALDSLLLGSTSTATSPSTPSTDGVAEAPGDEEAGR